MDEKNLLIMFCGTQGGLRTTALRKTMLNKKIHLLTVHVKEVKM